MSYATAEQLRDRYRQGIDGDEFAARDDADLEQALAAAAEEIDSWRPAGSLSAADLDVLRGKALPLARAYVYKDHALDPTHPVISDAAAARAWLRALAAGFVRLPSAQVATATEASPASPQVSAPEEVFGADFIKRHGTR